MPTPVILQAFDETNPPTVAQINTYFRTLVNALNALAGESVIEWSTAAPAEGVYLPITGGTLVGPLTLAGDATAALHAVPKQQLDAAVLSTGLLGMQVFTASGIYTPTPGARVVHVWGVAGGGGGGGTVALADGYVAAGGGGGGGSYGEWVGAAASMVVTVGASGAGVAGQTGQAGGTTSFGSALVLGGGQGGTVGAQAALAFGGGKGGSGGSGGLTSAGLLVSRGGDGEVGFLVSSVPVLFGGAGGGSEVGCGAPATWVFGGGVPFSAALSVGGGFGGGGAGMANYFGSGLGNGALGGGNGRGGILVVLEYL